MEDLVSNFSHLRNQAKISPIFLPSISVWTTEESFREVVNNSTCRLNIKTRTFYRREIRTYWKCFAKSTTLRSRIIFTRCTFKSAEQNSLDTDGQVSPTWFHAPHSDSDAFVRCDGNKYFSTDLGWWWCLHAWICCIELAQSNRSFLEGFLKKILKEASRIFQVQ